MKRPDAPDDEGLDGWLSEHPLMGRMPPDQRQLLLERSRIRELGPAEAVCREGLTPTAWFVLLEGQVRVSCTRPDGGQEVLAILHPGAVFGAVGFLCGQRRSATAGALESARVLEVPAELLDTGTGDLSVRIALELREILALSLTAQLRTLNRRLLRLGRKPGDEEEEEEAEVLSGWQLP